MNPDDTVISRIQKGACEHIGSDGKCADCTGDRTENCFDCGTKTVLAQAKECKTGTECGRVYCTDCAKDEINEHGYCSECAAIDCGGCEESFDRGTEKGCARKFCESKRDLCPECAPRLLNTDGLCAECSRESESDCNECGNRFTESRLTWCADEDCENVYCDNCKGEGLSAHGFCPDCATDECDGCRREFARGTGDDCAEKLCDVTLCASCADRRLNTDGLCSKCADDEEDIDCAECGETYISTRLTECEGEDCDKDYCDTCAPKRLRQGLCSACRD